MAITLMLKRPNDKEYIRPLWCFSLSRVSTQKHVSDSETKDALGPVWYVCLKTENCCLKTFVEIRVGEKVRWNAWNVV